MEQKATYRIHQRRTKIVRNILNDSFVKYAQ